MSDLLYDAVARIARHEAGARPVAALAVVSEVHTTVVGRPDHAVTVKLRDSGVVVPRVPVAVGTLGFAATLAPDDLVLVVFADGDVHGGVVVGRLYHRDLAPPTHESGQVVLQLPPGESSPAIDLRVDAGAPSLTLVVGSATVEVTGKTATVTIGDAELVVDGNSPASIGITAGEARLTLSGGGDVELEAAQNLTLKASQVKIEGSASVTVTGGQVKVN